MPRRSSKHKVCAAAWALGHLIGIIPSLVRHDQALRHDCLLLGDAIHDLMPLFVDIGDLILPISVDAQQDGERYVQDRYAYQELKAHYPPTSTTLKKEWPELWPA